MLHCVHSSTSKHVNFARRQWGKTAPSAPNRLETKGKTENPFVHIVGLLQRTFRMHFLSRVYWYTDSQTDEIVNGWLLINKQYQKLAHISASASFGSKFFKIGQEVQAMQR